MGTTTVTDTTIPTTTDTTATTDSTDTTTTDSTDSSIPTGAARPRRALGACDARRRAAHRERDDATLVAATLAGDAEAFGELYRRHHRGVGAAVSDWTRDPQRRHELVQDSFLRAMQQLHRLREGDRFRPWLLQIARNTAIDDARRQSRRRTESLELTTEPVAADGEPWHVVEMGMLAERVARFVAALSPREAAALTLTITEGYDQVALGAALGITPGHARVVLHRARRHLREAIERSEAPRAAMRAVAA